MTAGKSLSTTGMLNGISVEKTSLDDAVANLVRGVSAHAPAQVLRFVNSYTFALADTYPAYQSLLVGSGLNLPDGRPLVTALNQLDKSGQPFGQVRGPSFFVKCLDEGRA
jgi:N-acetylglucosaminyldiphosphoundecaprenol N-acetyl-beta-D-mannosaminyltransferase